MEGSVQSAKFAMQISLLVSIDDNKEIVIKLSIVTIDAPNPISCLKIAGPQQS